MAPRVRFLQKVQKQLSAKETSEKRNPLKETEQNKNTVSSLKKEGMEECRINSGGKLSDNRPEEKERRKETQQYPSSSEGTEESESECESKEAFEEEEKEGALSSRVPNTNSMQFFEDDDDDDDDTKDLDLLTVKRRDVFDLESKDSPALVSALYSKTYEFQ